MGHTNRPFEERAAIAAKYLAFPHFRYSVANTSHLHLVKAILEDSTYYFSSRADAVWTRTFYNKPSLWFDIKPWLRMSDNLRKTTDTAMNGRIEYYAKNGRIP